VPVHQLAPKRAGKDRKWPSPAPANPPLVWNGWLDFPIGANADLADSSARAIAPVTKATPAKQTYTA